MRYSPDSFEGEFEKAIRLLTAAMPEAEKLSKPTLLHNIRVAIYLYTRGYLRDVCLAGLLHDTIEDTPMMAEEIEREFGTRVRELVIANTKNEAISDKMETYADMMHRCIETGEDAAIIKAADILDNYWYFSKTGEKEKMEWMVRTGKMLLEKLPEAFKDPVFSELRSSIQQ